VGRFLGLAHAALALGTGPCLQVVWRVYPYCSHYNARAFTQVDNTAPGDNGALTPRTYLPVAASGCRVAGFLAQCSHNLEQLQ
jgi:hypothetical protein